MRLRSLSLLKRTGPGEVPLAPLPRAVTITRYAKERALAVNRLVRKMHGASFEWYGFTLAGRENPECVVDIGLPVNDRNIHRYAAIGPESISLFRDSLPPDTVINGWIHSHGDLDYKYFSPTDEANHLTVLDYVATFLRKPVARREVVIDDLRLAAGNDTEGWEAAAGSVWIVTDRPVAHARVFETVYGAFCYGILVGDGGWHRQDIYYRTRGILTGTTSASRREARMSVVRGERPFTDADREALAFEVESKIRPEAAEERRP